MEADIREGFARAGATVPEWRTLEAPKAGGDVCAALTLDLGAVGAQPVSRALRRAASTLFSAVVPLSPAVFTERRRS